MRARSLKPSLFKNEVLGAADALYTILFEGLWCEADREGRLEDRPLRLRAEIFPYRIECDVDVMLNWLSDHGFISRYEGTGGKRFIQILTFQEHQRPHVNEAPSVIPAMVVQETRQGKKRAQPRTQVLATKDTSTSLLILTPDSGLLTPDSGLPDTPRQSKPKPSNRVPEAFHVDPGLQAIAAELPADFDLEGETAKFRDHEFRVARSDWPAAWRKWMRTARDDGRYTRKPTVPGTEPPYLPDGRLNPRVWT